MASSFDLALLKILANGGNVSTQRVDKTDNDEPSAVKIMALRQCHLCSDQFRTNFALNRHVSAKHQVKYLKCGLCSAECMSEFALNRHKAERHDSEMFLLPSDIAAFQCEQCSFKFYEMSALKRHVQNEHAVDLKSMNGKNRRGGSAKGVECEHCPFIAVNKQGLKVHKFNKHTPASDKRWFACQYCSHKCKKKGNLTKHLKSMHSSVARFHQQSHEPQKHEIINDSPFLKCEHCSYGAKNASELKKHKLSMHIPVKSRVKNKRLHHCTQCSYATKWAGNIKRHNLVKHGEIQWKYCAQCSSRYKTDDSLRVHIKSKHKGVAMRPLLIQGEEKATPEEPYNKQPHA